MEIKFEYTLDGIGNNDFNTNIIFLLRNNKSMFCPFGNNVNEGEIECGSWCPHFNYDEIANHVNISCAGLLTFKIKEDKKT